MLTLVGNDYIEAGHRLEENFLYPGKNRIRSLGVEGSAEGAYESLIQAFDNELEAPPPEAKRKRPRKKTSKKKRVARRRRKG